MEESKVDRGLVCVLFPGIVKNEFRALECLGGIKAISQVYSQPTKQRLGLCYQPENPHIKRIYADFKNTAGVLMKVKVKKTKVNNEEKREVVSTTIMGRVNKIFKFESMCDFQYLPVSREGSQGQLQCILDKIVPSGVDNFSFMSEAAPLFIVPANFTRSDKPVVYSYTDKKYPDRKDETDDDIHQRWRSDRTAPITRYTFNLTDHLPTEPHEYFVNQMNARLPVYPQLQEETEAVSKLFEERPIWSQNLIRYHTKIKISSLKIIMPYLALYMKDGPWRMLWVRYGYDPRKDPGARIYQTLDFRIRHTAGVHSMVTTRDQVVHCKKANRVRASGARRGDEAPTAAVHEGAVYFRPGVVPAQRQIFYQYCDVKLAEVEQLILAEPPPGYLCHEKRGWLPPNTAEACRDHIFRNVKNTLLATYSADLKFEQASSDEESNSEDDSNNTTC